MAIDGYSSPPCYAHELAPDCRAGSPPMTGRELIGFFNMLLEAERAGAKAIATFQEDYERDTPAWRLLAALQRDEARNCANLIDLIRRVDGAPSRETGDFLGKSLAVEGRVARLQFLNRGQEWVARKLSEALPRVEQTNLRSVLLTMRDSHLLNIEACDALVEMLRNTAP